MSYSVFVYDYIKLTTYFIPLVCLLDKISFLKKGIIFSHIEYYRNVFNHLFI